MKGAAISEPGGLVQVGAWVRGLCMGPIVCFHCCCSEIIFRGVSEGNTQSKIVLVTHLITHLWQK